MARVGRPPLPQTTAALVHELLGQGLSTREVVAAAALRGVTVNKTSVWLIQQGRYREHSQLKPGEEWHDVAVRCPAGHSVNVTPCRTCAALASLDQMRQLAADYPSGPHKPRQPRGHVP